MTKEIMLPKDVIAEDTTYISQAFMLSLTIGILPVTSLYPVLPVLSAVIAAVAISPLPYITYKIAQARKKQEYGIDTIRSLVLNKYGIIIPDSNLRELFHGRSTLWYLDDVTFISAFFQKEGKFKKLTLIKNTTTPLEELEPLTSLS